MKSRILPLDGLRTFAALGVVWIHIWSFYNNPALLLFGIDFYKAIAFVGNGVDFFFVISGFCMYLMIDKNFSSKAYFNFLYKRFIRIAPAFFVSVIVYASILKYNDPSFNFWYNVLFHFLFLNNIVTGNVISGPFWSLGTEWHFYMLLPFLITLSHKFSLIKATLLFSVLSIFLFCIVNLGYLDFDFWEKQIVIRFPEFAIGIMAAYYFLNNKKLPVFFSNTKGLVIAFMILYLGRFLQYEPFLDNLGSIAFISKSIAPFIMCIGFGIVLYHVITNKSSLSTLLSKKIIVHLGKISFSIYLWHSLSIYLLRNILHGFNFGNANPIFGFLLILIITVCIAQLSYFFFESFYFKFSNNNYKKIPNI